MLNFIDNYLDRITMYRLVLYYLMVLIAAAGVLGYFGMLPFSPLALFYSTAVLVIISWLTNKLFSGILGVWPNVESVYITALILVLVISPPAAARHISYWGVLPFLFWAAVWSQAGKYIFNIGNKHIFNPAAFAVALTSLALGQSASWWVGTAPMLPLVFLGGLLLVRKVRRFDAVLAFLAAAFAVIFILGRSTAPVALQKALLDSPIIFFAAIMLTEPLTMPPLRDGRIAYGLLAGWLFAPQTHFGPLAFTPELALLAGNAFSFFISPKGRYVLKLKEKKPAGEGIYDFVFTAPRPIKFAAGQYMEWTLGHKNSDSRGNRRFFTLASSPTEREIILGVKFYENSSSFKQRLLALKPGQEITAGQLAGDFILPKNPKDKLVFLAGGVGITPFRSMLKYQLDKNERRNITVIYSNRKPEEIAYSNVLQQAKQYLGIKIVYTLTGKVSDGWGGQQGYVTAAMIKREVPDFLERTFYISGSHQMVEAFKQSLGELGVHRKKIKTDFFPGLV